ncbi:MAG: efflux transporter outer membrane subunit [Nitrospirales bacterium]|nr:efflux transporter outer membrane subunit [Nitrospirales bacterium]
MRVVVGLGLLMLLSVSCAMGPDYTRPALETADTFRMAETEGESIANLPWWDLLQDEALHRLIERALRENNNLKEAAASVEEFQARLYTARTAFIPQAAMTTNAPVLGRLNGFSAPGFASAFSYYGQGTLNWELDLWGRIRRSTEAAQAELMAREENRRAVVLQLVSGVAQSYFDLLQYDLQLDIARRTLLSWEESVTIARARVRRGVSAKLDADQFEAERANAAARVAQLERQMVQTENAVSVLLGTNPMPIPRGQALTQQVLPPEVPPGLPSELLQRRPDILRAEQALVAATARIGATKAARFPRLSITGLLGVASPQLSNLLDGGNEFGQAGLGLAGPVLNAETLGFEQRAVEAQAKQVLAQYAQTILVAFQEVEDALVAVRTAGTQRQAQEEQVTALRSALHLANLRYTGGITSYIDVLIAKRTLFEAELALASTHRLHLVSVVQLYKALGGGWSPEQSLARL